MQLQSRLLSDTVQGSTTDQILIINSALDPFALDVASQGQPERVMLAEDNISHVAQFRRDLQTRTASAQTARMVRHVPFHDYILQQFQQSAMSAGMDRDLAVMNLLYQPANAWMFYGVRAAHHALHMGGRLYVAGAKDRGILTVEKRIQEVFGNVETVRISKGQRVLRARKQSAPLSPPAQEEMTLNVFAGSKLDEGTRLLLEAIKVNPHDRALDLGCGAGFIGLHIAHEATQGHVVMVDVSLAAVAASREAVVTGGLNNAEVLASDGIAALGESSRSFELIATNPPFHVGGIQTTEVAERFIREAAQVLHPSGRFYLVANRFLKYEPVILKHFKRCEEVGGDGRYKVLCIS